MANQRPNNQIEALEEKVDTRTSRQRVTEKLIPLRKKFNSLDVDKWVELTHECFPWQKYKVRYENNGCELHYLQKQLDDDPDEMFTFVFNHPQGEKHVGKGSIGRILKSVVSNEQFAYKYRRAFAEEELKERIGSVETADESSYMDEQDFLEQRLDEQANERALAAEAEREGQRKAIVEAKAIILSEITQLNKEFNEIKAAKKAVTARALKNRANIAAANSRLETQHRKMEKLNTKDE